MKKFLAMLLALCMIMGSVIIVSAEGEVEEHVSTKIVLDAIKGDGNTGDHVENGGVLIANRDVPLVYMGEMAHHPIRLCDGKPENNRRPVYAWVMNNTWETNFKMDLSGFCEYRFTLCCLTVGK